MRRILVATAFLAAALAAFEAQAWMTEPFYICVDSIGGFDCSVALGSGVIG